MEAETSHTMMRPTHLSVESVSKTLQDVWELSLHSPAVMMGLTANEDEQWWSISFDRGRNWRYAAGKDTPAELLTQKLRDACDGSVVLWELTEGEDETPAPPDAECENAIFGFIYQLLPASGEGHGDTLYGCGLVNGFDNDGRITSSAYALLPPEGTDRMGELWHGGEFPYGADISDFLQSHQTQVAATIESAPHDDGIFAEDAIAMRVRPAVFVPDGDDGWHIVGLTEHPLSTEGHEDAEEDRPSPPLCAHLSDYDPVNDALVSWLSYFADTGVEDEDNSEELDVELLRIVSDSARAIRSQIRTVQNGESGGLPALVESLRNTAEMLYCYDEDHFASHFYEVSQDVERATSPVVAVGCDGRAEMSNRCLERLDDALIFALAWLVVTATGMLLDMAEQAEGKHAHIDNDLLAVLMKTLRDVTSLELSQSAPAGRRKWQQIASYLLRALKRSEVSQNQSVLHDSRRTLKLCRQLRERCLPHNLGVKSPTFLFGESYIETLGLYAWQNEGPHYWSLGDDDRFPRLQALTCYEHPSLTLLPPITGPFTETYEPTIWVEALAGHGHESVRVPLEDSYSTCSHCDCPLVPQGGPQLCPNCGAEIVTADLSSTVKQLKAVVSGYDTEIDLTDAACEMTPLFNAWIDSLRVRFGTGEG